MAASVCVPRVAFAQLPLPDFGQAPELQFASSDELYDATRTLAQSLKKELEARETALAAATETLEAPTAGTPEFRLRSLQQEEIDTLRDGLQEAERAASKARAKASVPESVTIPFVAELLENKQDLQQQAEARDRLAERLEMVAEIGPAPPGPRADLAQRIEYQAFRVQIAQARRARARALLTAVETRQVAMKIDAALPRLEVSPSAVEQARQSLVSLRAEAEVALEKIEDSRQRLLRTIPSKDKSEDPEEIDRKLGLARLELLLKERNNWNARVLRAEASLAASEALAEDRPILFSGSLSESRVAALQAELEEDWNDVQRLITEARRKTRGSPIPRSQQRAWERYQDTLDQTLTTIEQSRDELERIQLIRTLQTPPPSPWSPVAGLWGTIALTVLVAIVAVVLVRRGAHWFSQEPEQEPKGPLSRLSPEFRERASTLAVLIWPLLIIGLSLYGTLWGLWGLEIPPLEAFRRVDRPIFYIEDQPFSLFSLVKFGIGVWVALVLARVVRQFLNRRFLKRLGMAEGSANALSTFVYYLALLIGMVVALNFVGVGLSSLTVVLGVLGIGIGFGLRNITENFISGLIILAERPIQVGDFIDIDGKVEGQVTNIRARSTTLTTRDNISLIIPNSEFVGRQVTNWSHGDPKVRLRINVGVAYGSDTDLTRRTLLEVAHRHGQVLKRPAPEVQFSEFGSSSLDFILLAWIDEQFHRFRIASDLHFAIDKAFRKAGITIAFPQLDLHLKSMAPEVQGFLSPRLPRQDLLGGDEAPTEERQVRAPTGEVTVRSTPPTKTMPLPEQKKKKS